MDDWKYGSARDLGLPPQERVRSLHRESGLISTVLHHVWWSAARVYLKLWHSLGIEGREYLPAKPPYVLISNHASHLDVLALAASLPHKHRDRIFPIAAGEVFFNTPTAALFSALMLNALPMWRKKCGPHAMEELRTKLVDDPCASILFPEGARSRDGTVRSGASHDRRRNRRAGYPCGASRLPCGDAARRSRAAPQTDKTHTRPAAMLRRHDERPRRLAQSGRRLRSVGTRTRRWADAK